MRISDWSSDVCSSDLRGHAVGDPFDAAAGRLGGRGEAGGGGADVGELDGIQRAGRGHRHALAVAHAVEAGLVDAQAGGVAAVVPIGQFDLPRDRKSVVQGKSVSVRVDLGGRRIIKKKTKDRKNTKTTKHKKYQ